MPETTCGRSLFAFTALEVFVGKCIHWYKTQLQGLTERDHSSKIHTYLERLRQRKEEHVLSYKFALIASFLALDNLDETITKFDQAKNAVTTSCMAIHLTRLRFQSIKSGTGWVN